MSATVMCVYASRLEAMATNADPTPPAPTTSTRMAPTYFAAHPPRPPRPSEFVHAVARGFYDRARRLDAADRSAGGQHMKTFRNFVNGEFVDALDGATSES